MRTPGTSSVVSPCVRSKNFRYGSSSSPGRQQAEARENRRPAPVGQLEAEELDGQHVAGLGARDVDRPGQRVDGVEVERGEIVGRRVAPDLAAGKVVGLDHDDVALFHVQHGLDVDVPAPMGRHGSTDQMLGH